MKVIPILYGKGITYENGAVMEVGIFPGTGFNTPKFENFEDFFTNEIP